MLPWSGVSVRHRLALDTNYAIRKAVRQIELRAGDLQQTVPSDDRLKGFISRAVPAVSATREAG